jgi:hypothetical protein
MESSANNSPELAGPSSAEQLFKYQIETVLSLDEVRSLTERQCVELYEFVSMV